MHRITLCLALLSCAGVSALGQITSGEILGTVRDASGAAVSNAPVRIHNLGTNDNRDLTSGTDGAFRAPQLQPGSYEIPVTAKGFGK